MNREELRQQKIAEVVDALTADRDLWRDRCERLIKASRHWDSAGKAKAIQKEIDDDTHER